MEGDSRHVPVHVAVLLATVGLIVEVSNKFTSYELPSLLLTVSSTNGSLVRTEVEYVYVCMYVCMYICIICCMWLYVYSLWGGGGGGC